MITGIEQGQVWEMFSAPEARWVRVVVTNIDGWLVTLRYVGVLEFVTVDIADMENQPDRFRRAELGSIG
jgi:hypothetical protein